MKLPKNNKYLTRVTPPSTIMERLYCCISSEFGACQCGVFQNGLLLLLVAAANIAALDLTNFRRRRKKGPDGRMGRAEDAPA